MKKNTPLIIATLLIGVTVVLNFMVPEPGEYAKQGDRISNLVPLTFDKWASEGDLPVSDDVKRILGTEDVINRNYIRPGGNDRILLSLVFSGGHRHSMHPPEVCYQSQGHTLVGRSNIDLLPDCEATVLNLTHGSGYETLVNYWFFSEGRETPSYMWHQVHLVLNQIFFSSQPSVLIRFSTQVHNGNQEEAQALLTEFAAQAVPVIRGKLPSSDNESSEMTASAQ